MYGSWNEKFLSNHLIAMKRFYGEYLFSKSANSILKILMDCSFLRNNHIANLLVV